MSSDPERCGDDDEDGSGSSCEADARSIAAQNLSDLECGDDTAGSPVAYYSPSNGAAAASASASIDRVVAFLAASTPAPPQAAAAAARHLEVDPHQERPPDPLPPGPNPHPA